MNKKEKYFSESMLREKPKQRLALQIAPNAVTTDKIAPNAVTANKVHPSVIRDLVRPITDDLQNQIDAAEIGGFAVSNFFGDNQHVGISQKALTDAFYRVWQVLEDYTGVSVFGFNMTVSPTYFIGEDGCDVHITAASVDTVGIFEHIAFYINGEKVIEDYNVSYLEFDTEITETSIVRCEAKILGVEYHQEKTVSHYSSFWLGAGTSYQDIMNVEHVIPIANGMRGAYDVVIEDGQHIFVIVGENLREGFMRADINGIEIPFTETTVTVNENTYKVFKSDNAYTGGTYNVDING